MDRDLTRLKTLCRGLYYVLLLIAVVLLAVTVIVVAALVLVMVDPGLASDLELGIDEGNVPIAVGLMVVILAFVLVTVIVMMSIAKSIYREYTPFTKTNVRRLEVLAMAFLLLPVPLAPLVYVLMGELTAEDVILFSVGSVLTAAVFYCLALVFRYGSWLQKESDETL